MRPPLSVVAMPFAFSLLACALAINWWLSLRGIDMPWRAILPAVGLSVGGFAVLIGLDMLRMWWTRR